MAGPGRPEPDRGAGRSREGAKNTEKGMHHTPRPAALITTPPYYDPSWSVGCVHAVATSRRRPSESPTASSVAVPARRETWQALCDAQDAALDSQSEPEPEPEDRDSDLTRQRSSAERARAARARREEDRALRSSDELTVELEAVQQQIALASPGSDAASVVLALQQATGRYQVECAQALEMCGGDANSASVLLLSGAFTGPPTPIHTTTAPVSGFFGTEYRPTKTAAPAAGTAGRRVSLPASPRCAVGEHWATPGSKNPVLHQFSQSARLQRGLLAASQMMPDAASSEPAPVLAVQPAASAGSIFARDAVKRRDIPRASATADAKGAGGDAGNPKKTRRLAVVLQDFDSDRDGDLSLRVGGTIVLTKAPAGSEWWKGYVGGLPGKKRGVFPSSFVKEIPATGPALSQLELESEPKVETETEPQEEPRADLGEVVVDLDRDSPTESSAYTMVRQLSNELRTQSQELGHETDTHDREAVRLKFELLSVQQELESERKLVSELGQLTPQGLLDKESSCVICFDDTRLGIQCNGSTPHFICATCLNGYVTIEAGQDPRHIELRRGKIFCPLKTIRALADDDDSEDDDDSGCDSGALNDLSLVKLLEAEPFGALQKARERLMEAHASREAQAQSRREVDARIAQMESMGIQLFKHCDHIRERILTLKCPRCETAFADFDGCMALTCSVCGVGFCGWCLADCGEDAHKHVVRCDAKPRGADRFYATTKQYEAAWRERRQTLFDRYLLLTLRDREMRQDVASTPMIPATAWSPGVVLRGWLGLQCDALRCEFTNLGIAVPVAGRPSQPPRNRPLSKRAKVLLPPLPLMVRVMVLRQVACGYRSGRCFAGGPTMRTPRLQLRQRSLRQRRLSLHSIGSIRQKSTGR